MILDDLAAFLAVSALVIITPGQDTALTIRNALSGGVRGGISTAMGISVAQLAWSVVAAATVGSVLVSPSTIRVLAVAGGVYLVYLGLRALIAAGSGQERPTSGETIDPESAMVPLRQGFVSNALNPKMLVFFTVLLPRFSRSIPGIAALGLVFCSMTFAWLSVYTIVALRLGGMLQAGFARTMTAVTGTVLIGLGIDLVFRAGQA
jgi:threonine/homoserine/homoserine lactone efflux protein